MSKPPQLIDQAQRARHLARASDPFLQGLAADELEDRLRMVNRRFQSAALVTPFPEHWQKRFPDAQVITQAETLELEPASRDLVIHALGLHWANDPVGQIIQCRRALQPDGLFLCSTVGGRSLHELREVLAAAEIQVSGGISPRVLPMGDIRDVGALLQRSGLALPVADSDTHQLVYRDLFHLMHDLRAMGETNALAERLRHPTRRQLFNVAAEIYAERFGNADGKIIATFEVVTLTGWAPSETQPKPLRPGSATNRLADVLGAVEGKLKD